jgi:hypothetical protein
VLYTAAVAAQTLPYALSRWLRRRGAREPGPERLAMLPA